jgi:hypothetical protein
MIENRPWKLVAPWYYWTRQIAAGPATGPRSTRPAFQKFDQSDFVDGFLKAPQRSLKFKDDVDQVFAVNLIPAPVLSGGVFSGKSITFFAPRTGPGGSANPQRASLVPQGIRKIFLDTHKRYYLVVCELHCDAPGFPTAPASHACQAGFVVRRRYLKYPRSAQPAALALLKEIVAVEAQIAELDQTAPLRPAAARKRAVMVEKLRADGSFPARRAGLLAQLASKRAELQRWKDDNGVLSVQEGWFPGPFDKVGSWDIVEDAPSNIRESYLPLYPLFANPDIPDHDAEGRTIYFGVLPTSSLDTDDSGRARFDDRSIYEVRCFVRRHKVGCPRTQTPPDCGGELFWSEPTEAYRLASQFDLVGTANRPITIQVPDLAELAAQAATLPFGKFAPVKFVQPQSLRPSISGGMSLSGGSMGGQAICFFAIPLITIVALFVLQLFLPIVIFIFGLWFLLAFKFCIPPSFQIDAGLQAELNAIPPAVNVDAAFSVTVGGVTKTAAQIQAELKAQMEDAIEANEGFPPGTLNLGAFANSPLIQLNKTFVAEKALPTDVANDPPVGLDLTASLEFEVREDRLQAEALVS